MKIQTAFLLLILGCLFVCPTGVRGDLTTGTILVDWGAGTLAGEFLIQATGFAGQGTSTADPGWFETFCLEYNEDLPEMGDVYDVVLNTVAVSGGLDSSSGSVEG